MMTSHLHLTRQENAQIWEEALKVKLLYATSSGKQEGATGQEINKEQSTFKKK